MRSELLFAFGICVLGACAVGVSDGELGDDDGETSLGSGTGGTTLAVAAGPDASTTGSPSTTTMTTTGSGTNGATSATGMTTATTTTNAAATSPASAAVGPATVASVASTGGGPCAHSPCDAGGPLSISCDPCVTYICTFIDPTCCQSVWDADFCGLFASVYCAQCA